MRKLKRVCVVFLILLGTSGWFVGTGCGRKQASPPKALAPEQVAPTIQIAFQGANPEVKGAANEVVSAIQNQDEPRALVQLQALSANPLLTPEQRAATIRSMMSVLARVQTAAANGNTAAEEMLKKYRASK